MTIPARQSPKGVSYIFSMELQTMVSQSRYKALVTVCGNTSGAKSRPMALISKPLVSIL